MGAQKWLESTQNETPARQVFLWAKNKCVSALSLHQRVSESNMSMMDNCSSMSKQYNTWYSTRYGIENLMFVPYCISIVIEEWKRNVCYLLGECVAETERILKQRWFFSDLLVKLTGTAICETRMTQIYQDWLLTVSDYMLRMFFFVSLMYGPWRV